MRQRNETGNEEEARLHERAALFYELLDHHDRAAAERERAQRARAAARAASAGAHAGPGS
ncbi:MAG: hypothetical protein ICV64_01150, partial [Thermoleophilia bacterium]|nr:hypothetical protein [Thermoleophilia bacterium]